MQIVLDARQRIHGVPPALAIDQKAGSVLGRLYLAGKLSESLDKAEARRESDALYEAGEKFRKDWDTAMRFIQPPKGLNRIDAGSDMDWDSEHFDRDKYTRLAIAATGNHQTAKARLSADEWVAVEAVVLFDSEPLTVYGLGPLRSGLMALAKGYGMIGKADRVPA